MQLEKADQFEAVLFDLVDRIVFGPIDFKQSQLRLRAALGDGPGIFHGHDGIRPAMHQQNGTGDFAGRVHGRNVVDAASDVPLPVVHDKVHDTVGQVKPLKGSFHHPFWMCEGRYADNRVYILALYVNGKRKYIMQDLAR